MRVRSEDKAKQKVKYKIHPRSKHRGRYDFEVLCDTHPPLSEHMKLNPYDQKSINFSDANAVKALNTALLKHFYDIKYWDLPKNYLCPGVPGRADYIHHIADLLASCYDEVIPQNIKVLDIGTGANCIYPIIGTQTYDWQFVGSEVDVKAIENAQKIIENNPGLGDKLEIRKQVNNGNIFHGIIQENECFDLTICNPPFHASAEEAMASSLRKTNNLSHKKEDKPNLNFSGQKGELWYEGGEKKFVQLIIEQSRLFGDSCFWYSTLVSKYSNLKGIYKSLRAEGAVAIRTLPMGQGNKSSRVVAWTFLSKPAQTNWIKSRWIKGNQRIEKKKIHEITKEVQKEPKPKTNKSKGSFASKLKRKT
ncbi:MAG: 23S rRNA (adenine(1618)-N(6))-methyltransferase RlmF [Flavobacteriales bacterium]|nr:23S rRNA (adenine(1618)-N(6))-methyltransferase RlmF [Flavobacteriales bacterium]